MEQGTKLSKLIIAAKDGDWRMALSIAAKFPRLGPDKAIIMRAHGCFANPDFYAQLGFAPEDCIAQGIAALRRKYKIS